MRLQNGQTCLYIWGLSGSESARKTRRLVVEELEGWYLNSRMRMVDCEVCTCMQGRLLLPWARRLENGQIRKGSLIRVYLQPARFPVSDGVHVLEH